MDKESDNQQSVVKRPWQGTALAVMQVIGAVLVTLNIIGMFIFLHGGGVFLNTSWSDFAVIRLIVFILSIAIIVFSLLVAVGLFKGWKWSVIVMSVISIVIVLTLAIYGVYMYRSLHTIITSGGFSFFGYLASQLSIPLLYNIVALYWAYICYKHPYYNQKKTTPIPATNKKN